MNIGGIDIDYEPGEGYESEELSRSLGEFDEERKQRREDARQEAIRAFSKGAQGATTNQLNQAIAATLGLVIQLRALGGRGDRDLANKLREAADFLEDL